MRLYPYKTRVVNCFPSFLITWITSSSPIGLQQCSVSFVKCWQLSAIRRTASPVSPCRKENVSFTLTETALTVVLITRHCTYSYIKLMHNKEVLYPFPFLLTIPSQQGRQRTYHVTVRGIYVTIVAEEQ